MGGAHTIVVRPTSPTYALTLVANNTLAPVQLVPFTNEISNFVSLINTGSAPAIVQVKGTNFPNTFTLPVAGTPVQGYVLPANMIFPIVIPASLPNVFIQAFSTAALTIYATLVQNQ